MTTLSFNVFGVPAPQGSKSAYVVGKRAVVVDGTSQVGRAAHKAWRTAVTEAAVFARIAQKIEQFDGPVYLRVDFTMPRPQSAPKRWTWAFKKPDIDKLLRSTMDGLTDAGVWKDDSRVALVTASKRLTDGAAVGAHVEITLIDH